MTYNDYSQRTAGRRTCNDNTEINFRRSSCMQRGNAKRINMEIHFHDDVGSQESIPISAGNAIEGTVLLELKHPLKHIPATTSTTTGSSTQPMLNLVTFQLHGIEVVRMRKVRHIKQWCRSDNINYYTPMNHRGVTEKIFFTIDGTLNEFPRSSYNAMTNCIVPGRYEFPFRIPLPDHLPGSMSYGAKSNKNQSPKGCSRSKLRPGFRIQYELSIKVHNDCTKPPYNGSMITTTSNKQVTSVYDWCDRLVWVSSKVPTIPTTSVPSAVVTKTIHRSTKNTILIAAAQIDDTTVAVASSPSSSTSSFASPHDSINIRVACRNESRIKIRRVDVQVLEKLRWGSAGIQCKNTPGRVFFVPHDGTTRVLYELKGVKSSTLQTERISLWKSLGRSLAIQPSSAEREVYVTSTNQALYDDLKSDSSLFAIRLPASTMMDVRDPYIDGQLVQIQHEVEIKFITRRKASNEHNPTITIPIHVYRNAVSDSGDAAPRPRPIRVVGTVIQQDTTETSPSNSQDGDDGLQASPLVVAIPIVPQESLAVPVDDNEYLAFNPIDTTDYSNHQPAVPMVSAHIIPEEEVREDDRQYNGSTHHHHYTDRTEPDVVIDNEDHYNHPYYSPALHDRAPIITPLSNLVPLQPRSIVSN